MKKIAKILLPLALCFVLLAGCGQKVEWANPEDYQDHPYQELSLGELADPERIVLAKNGREKSVFDDLTYPLQNCGLRIRVVTILPM